MSNYHCYNCDKIVPQSSGDVCAYCGSKNGKLISDEELNEMKKAHLDWAKRNPKKKS